jgi:hypothetical protein
VLLGRIDALKREKNSLAREVEGLSAVGGVHRGELAGKASEQMQRVDSLLERTEGQLI